MFINAFLKKYSESYMTQLQFKQLVTALHNSFILFFGMYDIIYL